MADVTESNRQTIREAFEAWQAGTGAIADVFADDLVWRIEGHSLASREDASRRAVVGGGPPAPSGGRAAPRGVRRRGPRPVRGALRGRRAVPPRPHPLRPRRRRRR